MSEDNTDNQKKEAMYDAISIFNTIIKILIDKELPSDPDERAKILNRDIHVVKQFNAQFELIANDINIYTPDEIKTFKKEFVDFLINNEQALNAFLPGLTLSDDYKVQVIQLFIEEKLDVTKILEQQDALVELVKCKTEESTLAAIDELTEFLQFPEDKDLDQTLNALVLEDRANKLQEFKALLFVLKNDSSAKDKVNKILTSIADEYENADIDRKTDLIQELVTTVNDNTLGTSISLEGKGGEPRLKFNAAPSGQPDIVYINNQGFAVSVQATVDKSGDIERGSLLRHPYAGAALTYTVSGNEEDGYYFDNEKIKAMHKKLVKATNLGQAISKFELDDDAYFQELFSTRKKFTSDKEEKILLEIFNAVKGQYKQALDSKMEVLGGINQDGYNPEPLQEFFKEIGNLTTVKLSNSTAELQSLYVKHKKEFELVTKTLDGKIRQKYLYSGLRSVRESDDETDKLYFEKAITYQAILESKDSADKSSKIEKLEKQLREPRFANHSDTTESLIASNESIRSSLASHLTSINNIDESAYLAINVQKAKREKKVLSPEDIDTNAEGSPFKLEKGKRYVFSREEVEILNEINTLFFFDITSSDNNTLGSALYLKGPDGKNLLSANAERIILLLLKHLAGIEHSLIKTANPEDYINHIKKLYLGKFFSTQTDKNYQSTSYDTINEIFENTLSHFLAAASTQDFVSEYPELKKYIGSEDPNAKIATERTASMPKVMQYLYRELSLLKLKLGSNDFTNFPNFLSQVEKVSKNLVNIIKQNWNDLLANEQADVAPTAKFYNDLLSIEDSLEFLSKYTEHNLNFIKSKGDNADNVLELQTALDLLTELPKILEQKRLANQINWPVENETANETAEETAKSLMKLSDNKNARAAIEYYFKANVLSEDDVQDTVSILLSSHLLEGNSERFNAVQEALKEIASVDKELIEFAVSKAQAERIPEFNYDFYNKLAGKGQFDSDWAFDILEKEENEEPTPAQLISIAKAAIDNEDEKLIQTYSKFFAEAGLENQAKELKRRFKERDLKLSFSSDNKNEQTASYGGKDPRNQIQDDAEFESDKDWLMGEKGRDFINNITPEAKAISPFDDELLIRAMLLHNPAKIKVIYGTQVLQNSTNQDFLLDKVKEISDDSNEEIKEALTSLLLHYYGKDNSTLKYFIRQLSSENIHDVLPEYRRHRDYISSYTGNEEDLSEEFRVLKELDKHLNAAHEYNQMTENKSSKRDSSSPSKSSKRDRLSHSI